MNDLTDWFFFPSAFITVLVLFPLPSWLSGKEATCQCRRHGFYPWVRKVPWRRKWQPTPVFLPGESHGQGSLAGYSPWGGKELDTTEQLTATLSLLHEKMDHPKKSSMREICVCLYLDCCDDHLNTCVIKLCRTKHTHTHTRVYKTGEIWIRFVDCPNLSFLVMLLHCSYARCYH